MGTPSTTVKLHPAQQAFLKSDSLFRAFCGGIGSGKSWAGSYDLIKRTRAGRLYAVIAPTYQMLLDSTFRSFLSVAEQIAVVNMGEVKKSAPPSIKLRTGAEVLFRSADDPSRLYGPNLSGIWLDEASLMPADVFHVGIGRLREQGEQGFLTATFTPKGRGHWTHGVFNTGRPNTAIFFAKTGDNPFLPAAFASTVAAQYTSRLAMQELEGRFIDPEGGLFRRTWFGIVDAAPKSISTCRAWDLAATPKDERRASDPDWSAGVLMGKDEQGTVYLLDVKRLRGSPKQVEAAVRRMAELDGKAVPVWMEQEPGSAGTALADHYARQVLFGFNFHAERSTGDKATRAQPLAAACERGLVKLVSGHWVKDFLDEAELFPFSAHDDQIDAASLAFGKLAAKRKVWLGYAGEVVRDDGRKDGWDGKPRIVPPEEFERWKQEARTTRERAATNAKEESEPKQLPVDVRPGARGWERFGYL
jgi:predicted phage terminase large subunit-like protein